MLNDIPPLGKTREKFVGPGGFQLCAWRSCMPPVLPVLRVTNGIMLPVWACGCHFLHRSLTLFPLTGQFGFDAVPEIS